MNKVGIIYNALIPEAKDLGNAILERLALPAESWIASAEDEDTLRQHSNDTDLVITAGGDGTILRVVRMTAPSGIPVVGINMGRLGFMTELRAEEAMERLPIYLNGGCRVEARNMIQARVVKDGGGAEVNGPYHALNDVVMARGAVSRVVTIGCNIDEARLTTFRADAVIVSTATGSTGYNLAVGGPILDPESEDLVLKPVAAHIGLSAGCFRQGNADPGEDSTGDPQHRWSSGLSSVPGRPGGTGAEPDEGQVPPGQPAQPFLRHPHSETWLWRGAGPGSPVLDSHAGFRVGTPVGTHIREQVGIRGAYRQSKGGYNSPAQRAFDHKGDRRALRVGVHGAP